MPSMAPRSRASSAVAASASVTVDSAHSALRPRAVGDRAHQRGRVLDDLLFHRFRDVFAAARDRRRRADVRTRRHQRDVARERQERARARGVGAGWRDPHDHRQRGIEDGHHDATRLVERTARGVQRDDDGVSPVAVGLRDPVLEVAGHDRVDDAARRQHRNPRRVVGATGRRAGKHEDRAEDERDREQEATDSIDATEHRDLRHRYRTAARSRNSKQSRLQVSMRSTTDATSCGSANEPESLSVSRISTGRPAASAT